MQIFGYPQANHELATWCLKPALISQQNQREAERALRCDGRWLTNINVWLWLDVAQLLNLAIWLVGNKLVLLPLVCQWLVLMCLGVCVAKSLDWNVEANYTLSDFWNCQLSDFENWYLKCCPWVGQQIKKLDIQRCQMSGTENLPATAFFGNLCRESSCKDCAASATTQNWRRNNGGLLHKLYMATNLPWNTMPTLLLPLLLLLLLLLYSYYKHYNYY